MGFDNIHIHKIEPLPITEEIKQFLKQWLEGATENKLDPNGTYIVTYDMDMASGDFAPWGQKTLRDFGIESIWIGYKDGKPPFTIFRLESKDGTP